MAKNRNKKKKNDSSQMDVTYDHAINDAPQAMDTSESAASKTSIGGPHRKIKKGVQLKRSKNVRKMKAIAKAISENEKQGEKLLKNDSKKQRTQNAKKLYD